MIQKIAVSTAVALSIVLGALALWVMREAVLLLIISLAISSAMTPMIEYLLSRGLKRSWAITITFFGVLLPLLALMILLGIQVINDIAVAIDRVPAQYNQLRQMLLNNGSLSQSIGSSLPDSQSIITGISGSRLESLGNSLLNAVTQTTVIAVVLVSIASLGFYWLADQQRIERLLLSLLPAQNRGVARSLWHRIYREVGVTIRGEVTLVACGIIGLFLGYWLLGITGASLLAVYGGLMLLVPALGIPLAILPGVLIAAIQHPANGLVVLGGGSLILLVIKRSIAPRIFRADLTINPVLTVVLIMALAEVIGFWAFLVALPLAAAIQALWHTIRVERQGRLPVSQTLEAHTLQERIDKLAQQIATEQPDAVRLKGLLDRAQKLASDVTLLANQQTSSVSASVPAEAVHGLQAEPVHQ